MFKRKQSTSIITSSKLVLALMILFLGSTTSFVQAHGGEDHGDQKPKTTSNEKGTVSHSTRLGDVELMIKHPALEPDVATQAQLFVTNFETNEPVGNVAAAVEIESANGAVTTATVEPGAQPGVYNIKLPAFPEGNYVVRARITYKGETDTATFSGVRVEPRAVATKGGASSWLASAGILIVFGFVVTLLAGLGFLVWNFAGKGAVRNEEAMSIRV
jgi:hypothetical protein